MNYKYTARNLLDEPHNYMYSDFKGEEFLSDYLENRIYLLCNLVTSDHCEFTDLDQHVSNEAFNVLSRNKSSALTKIPSNLIPQSFDNLPSLHKSTLPKSFPNQEKIETFQLLEAILHSYLFGESLLAEVWLNRFVQRFEVTKKLGKYYLPGFRKSEGGYEDIRLYQVFSIVLAFAHSQSNHFQWLSTLLKVNDLLLSLPQEMFNFEGNIPSWNAGVVIEVNAVFSFLKS